MSAQVHLKAKREKSLQKRHPWVFTGAVAKVKGKPSAGETVEVRAADGTWLARGSYSPKSQICVRAWTFLESEEINSEFFQRRIEVAYAQRQALGLDFDGSAYRLVAAEADGLPGLIIDRYDNVLVCQFAAAGVEYWKASIVEALKVVFPALFIYERSDVDVRKKEGLPLLSGPLTHQDEDWPEFLTITENSFKLAVDYRSGHKTGYYLDQRDNRKLVEDHAKNKRVLNCFCYTGTFGVYALAGGAKEVIQVDASGPALEQAEKNLVANQLDLSRNTFVKADVFELLREYKQADEKFDMIILDPPKFVDHKAHLEKAARGYKDINRLALELLNPKGILFTFSCSGLVSADYFEKIIAFAALDAGRDVQIIRRMGQASDHPVATNFPEGFYLKGLVCYVK